jgi:hypothetical protein
MPEALAGKQPLKGVPPQIFECELDQYCDGLWTFDGASGKAVWPRNPQVLADLTVESFSPDRIVIRRKDTTPNGYSVVYTGRLEGNRISGMAEAHTGAKSVTYNWTAIVPATSCVRTDGLKPDTQEALDIGRIAQRFNLLPAALDCYLIAARNGDAAAQNTVAYMYKLGKGTEADPAKAQYWSQQLAANPEGQSVAQLPVDQAEVNEICQAKQTRAGMQIVEEQSMKDPNGAARRGAPRRGLCLDRRLSN